MKLSDFRADARQKLSGKWLKSVSFSLVYILVWFVLELIYDLCPDSIKTFIDIISYIFIIPLNFGLIIAFVKLYNNKNVKVFDFFSLGFSNFKKSWRITLLTLLKMLIPVILIVVSSTVMNTGMILFIQSAALQDNSSATGFLFLMIIGFIFLIISVIWATTKFYYYQLAYILAAENPELSSKDIVLQSKKLMTNNRFKLFSLHLSIIIGWVVLFNFITNFVDSILLLRILSLPYLWLFSYIIFATISFYKYLINGNLDN